MISLYKMKTFCVCKSVGKSLMGLIPLMEWLRLDRVGWEGGEVFCSFVMVLYFPAWIFNGTVFTCNTGCRRLGYSRANIYLLPLHCRGRNVLLCLSSLALAMGLALVNGTLVDMIYSKACHELGEWGSSPVLFNMSRTRHRWPASSPNWVACEVLWTKPTARRPSWDETINSVPLEKHKWVYVL